MAQAMPPKTLLPKNLTVEVHVHLLNDAGIPVHTGICCIDKGDDKAPTFFKVASAVQCGSYEVLKSIWPQEKKK